MATGFIGIDMGVVLNAMLSTTITDFNAVSDVTRVVIGKWSGNTLNKPSGGYTGFFIHVATSANYGLQVAANIQFGDRIYIRHLYGGTWSDWATITAS